MACGVGVHEPSHRFTTRARPRGDMLADDGSAGGQDPPVRSIKVTDENVEMHAGH